MEFWRQLALAFPYIIFILMIWNVGNEACRLVLRLGRRDFTPLADTETHAGDDVAEKKKETTQRLNAGALIGGLERSLVVIGVIGARWEIIAAVVAIKTVARYKELEKQLNAEYFLIGSLFSLLWGTMVAVLILIYDARFGFQIIPSFRALLAASGAA